MKHRQQATEAYRALDEHSLQGLIIFQERRIVFANSRTAEILGCSAEALQGMTMTNVAILLCPEQRALGLERLAEHELGKPLPPRVTYRIVRENGTFGWAEVYSNRIEYQGRPAVQSIFLDVTDRMLAEQALRESETRYRTLFETMAQGVVYQDANGQIRAANPAAERILGLSLDQMQGRTSLDPRWRAIREDGTEFPGKTHPSMVALHTGQEVQDVVMGVFNPKRERYVWIKVNAMPQFRPDEEAPYQVYTTFEDISARVYAERALRDSEERYRRLNRELELHVEETEGRVEARTAELWARMREVEALNRAMANLVEDLKASHRIQEATGHRLQQANRLIMALGQVATRLQGSLEPGLVLETLVGELVQLNLSCAVLLLDDETRALTVRHVALGRGDLVAVETLTGLPVEGLVIPVECLPHYVELCDGREAISVNGGIDLVAGVTPQLAQSELACALSLVGLGPNDRVALVPLAAKNQVLGVLGVWGQDLQTEDLPTLTVLGGQAAAALEVARLHEQLRAERIEEQSALLRLTQALLVEADLQAILDQTVGEAARALAADMVVLTLAEDGGRCYSARAWRGWPADFQAQIQSIPIDDRTPMGRALRDQVPVVVADLAQEQDCCGDLFVRATAEGSGVLVIAPLLSDGKALGGLAVIRRKARVWTEDEVRLLSLVANSAAQAVERSRLLAAERQQRELAEVLREAGLDLSATLDVDVVLDRLLDHIHRVILYEAATVLWVENGRAISRPSRRFGRHHGEQVPGRLSRQSFKIEETDILHTMAERGQALVIPDTDEYEGWQPLDETARGRSWVGAPVVVQGELLAFFGLLHSQPGFYGDRQAEILSSFAGQAGLALQNARLFRELRAGRERLQALSRRLAEVEEAERQRLARELHDQVGQNLTALGIHLNIVRAHAPRHLSEEAVGPLRSRIDDCLALVDETTDRVRSVMADLRPPLLDDYGLVAALRWYGEHLTARTGIAVAVQGTDLDPRLPTHVENELFRIAQEALTNVAKHARVKQATVVVEVGEAHLSLVIADEGAGFDPERVRTGQSGQQQHLGLVSMSERAEAVGGCFRIESHPGSGTRVIVEVSR